MGQRVIKLSIMSAQKEYTCQHDWPEDCRVQGGDRGLVIDPQNPEKSYTTAFIEVFPQNPNTFIRGEGATPEEAENKAWEKYQRALACPGHEFERRGYTNGAGFCKHCGMFAPQAFEPSTKCKTCGKPTDFAADVDGNYYCEDHQRDIPFDKWTRVEWFLAYSEYKEYCRNNGVPFNIEDY
jgi:hypothetical protein